MKSSPSQEWTSSCLPPCDAQDIFPRAVRRPPILIFAKGEFVRLDRLRQRSIGFLEKDEESWSCFLVTYQDEVSWRGYFSFRPRGLEGEEDEVRTADIFIEDSENLIDRKARDLGRPLLTGLLASALHARARAGEATPRLRGWFRTMLQNDSRKLSGEWEDDGSEARERTLTELQSMYASYRLDQVSHLITLVRSEDFHEMVERILDGEAFDFGMRDRLQFAMMVVEFIERRLPLPPFEVWVEDYLANPEEYRLYTHTLHRTGFLP